MLFDFCMVFVVTGRRAAVFRILCGSVITLFVPSHEITCLCHMRTTKTQISLRIRVVSEAKATGLSLTWFQTPEDRISHDVAHLCSVCSVAL